MKALAGSIRIVVKLSLVAQAVLAVTLALGQDSRRVAATHSEVHLATSAASSQHVGTIFLPQGATKTLYVRAKDVTHDTSGVAAFDVDLKYDPNVLSVTTIQAATSWLGSTSRPVSCKAPIIEPVLGDATGLWHASASCFTTGSVPPWGALGGGLLATVTLVGGTQPGNTILTNESVLFNTTVQMTEIPVTLRSSVVVVARCGDVNVDGVVTGGDIAGVVLAFGRLSGQPGWDPVFDLNDDSAITGGDIALVVVQFGSFCAAG